MDQITGKGAEESPWPKGLSAITLFVENLQAAEQFYRHTFGLPVVYADVNSTVFKIGETMINLLQTTASVELLEPATAVSPSAGARLVFTIPVEDVDAMCAELTGRGVELLNGPLDRPWGIRTASFLDLDGHVWEIAR